MFVSQVAPTMIDLLQRRAGGDAPRWGYTFCGDRGERVTLRVDELERRARAIAAALQDTCKPGDRALLVYPPGLDFIAGFFGCLFAGVLPVPATYPKPRRPMPRLSAINVDCAAAVALTTAQTLETLDQARTAAELTSLPWLATDGVPDDAASAWRRPHIGPNDLAFLQYTSGSTSLPKGVAVTHGNLLHNLQMIRESFDIPGIHGAARNGGQELPPCAVSWLPAYHDMGLIGGIFHSLFSAFPLVLLSPASFLQRPLCWLEMISSERGTVTGAPNFAYELCVARSTPEERAKLDLSSVRLSLCAAEPIRAQTLERFIEAFAVSGFPPDAFYPCYGLAESTLLGTGPQGPVRPKSIAVSRAALGEHRFAPPDGEGPDVQRLVACGHALLGQQVAIVDPETRKRRADGNVGEIWLAGHSVTHGYWQRPELTEQMFAARIADETSPPFLRTGDLGFVQDGELYVTGRLKDVIIIRGRNHYPQDIERTAFAAHAILQPDGSAAFTLDVDDEERLVVVLEVDRHHRAEDLPEAMRAVRVAIAGEHELHTHAIALIRQAGLPRTTSGKIQRSLCRTKWLQGELKVVSQWSAEVEAATAGPGLRSSTAVRFNPDADRIEIPAAGLTTEELDRLAERIETRLIAFLIERADMPAADADRHKPFAEYGLDSFAAVELSADLERWLRVRIPAVAAWNYPTPASLALFLAEQAAAAAGPTSSDNAPPPQAAGVTEFESLLGEIERWSDQDVRTALEEGRNASSADEA